MSEKMQIAINEHGRPIGEDHHRAKLTNGEVDLILDLRDAGWSYGEIARKMEIGKSTVFDICKGRRRCQTIAGHKAVRISG